MVEFAIEHNSVSAQNDKPKHMETKISSTSVDKDNINQSKKNGLILQPRSEVWCPDLHLDEEDKDALANNKWLSDKHIHAAQKLLKKKFPHIGGLQPPILSQTGQWQVMSSEGIQILHCRNHWICVSTIGCPENTINLYDSMNHRKTSQGLVVQISSFTHYIARLQVILSK